MSRQRIRHFAVALSLSVIVTAASAMPAVAGIATPPKALSSATKGAPAQAVVGTAAAHTSREIFGFALASSLSDPTVGYPSWNFDLLSTVAVFGVHVDTAGRFVADNGWTVWNSSALTGLVTTAHQHGVKVVLTIVLQDFSANTPNMCAGLAHADATVAETVSEVSAKGVDGVNIDYEGLDGGCGTGDPYWAQHAMTGLAAKMRSALGSSSYLSVDTYSGAASDPTDSLTSRVCRHTSTRCSSWPTTWSTRTIPGRLFTAARSVSARPHLSRRTDTTMPPSWPPTSRPRRQA